MYIKNDNMHTLWRHDMETLSALLAVYERNPLNSYYKGPAMQKAEGFFIVNFDKLLNK